MIVGDDCVAISGGSSYVNITGVMCGPGHGFRFAFLSIFTLISWKLQVKLPRFKYKKR